MRAVEVGEFTQMLANIIVLTICVLLLGYLFAALLWPEKF
jgi:K+-transporting ATPase KdpF subunit